MIDRRLLCLNTPEPSPGPVALDLSRRLRTEPQTRRWFLRAGMSLGAILALSVFPSFPVSAAGATIFVSSALGDNSTGATWQAAKTTIAGGIAAAAVGDFVIVDKNHAFTATAAITYTPPAGGLAIISVTPTGTTGTAYTGPTAGATESIGAASNNFAIASAAASSMYVFGLTMNGTTNNAANGINLATGANINYLEMVSCTYDLKAANTGSNLTFGASGGVKSCKIRMRNCTYICSGSRAGTWMLGSGAATEIINPTFSITGGTKPVTLFAPTTSGEVGSLTIRDGDATGFATASSALVAVGSLSNYSVLFKNLKLSATPTLTSGTWPGGNAAITVINSDSGNTNYVFQYVNSYGTLTADTTVYKNSGSTFNGTPISWKIVTSSLASQFNPFVTPYLPSIWAATTTSQTPTLSIAQASGATNLNDLTCWPTIDFAASASATNYTYQTARNALPFVGTGADWAADSGATWTGIATPNKQLVGAGAFAAAQAGMLQGRLHIAAASATLYVDLNLGGVT